MARLDAQALTGQRAITANMVADFLLIEQEEMTHLKLQKLCYYAQGYGLALLGRPIFPDAIEAWEHGPVVRSVYNRFRGRGRVPILASPEAAKNIGIFPAEVAGVIRRVLAEKGRLGGWALREQTHNELPWRLVYGTRNPVIPISVMARWFRERVQH